MYQILLFLLLIILVCIISLLIINIKNYDIKNYDIKKYKKKIFTGGALTGNELYELFKFQETFDIGIIKSLNIFNLSNLGTPNIDNPNDLLKMAKLEAEDLIAERALLVAKKTVIETTKQAAEATCPITGCLIGILGPILNTISYPFSSSAAPEELTNESIGLCLNNSDFQAYVEYKFTNNSKTEIDSKSIRIIAVHRGNEGGKLFEFSAAGIANWIHMFDNIQDTSKYTYFDHGDIPTSTYFDFYNTNHETQSSTQENIARAKFLRKRHISNLGHRAIKLLLRDICIEQNYTIGKNSIKPPILSTQMRIPILRQNMTLEQQKEIEQAKIHNMAIQLKRAIYNAIVETVDDSTLLNTNINNINLETRIKAFLSMRLTTLGHGPGAAYAYMYGDEGFEVIVYNPAPYPNNIPPNTWVIKRDGDLISKTQHHRFTDQNVLTLKKINDAPIKSNTMADIEIQYSINALKDNPYLYGNPMLYSKEITAENYPIYDGEEFTYNTVKTDAADNQAQLDNEAEIAKRNTEEEINANK